MSNAMPPRSSTASYAGSELPRDTIEVDLPSKASNDNLRNLTTAIEVSEDLGDRAENKQKRKRTSSKDQAILEAEFKQNPKPSKATRAEIVRKVDLNEKEVQIWFQNQRQIQRRKSQPLLPHEITALALSSEQNLLSDPAPALVASISSSQCHELERPVSQTGNRGQKLELQFGAVGSQESSAPQTVEEDVQTGSSGKIVRVEKTVSASAKGESFETDQLESTSTTKASNLSTSFSSTPGYLSNRWKSSFSSLLTPNSSQSSGEIAPISNDSPASCPEQSISRISPPSGPSGSRVRLSMSLNGSAELVSTDSSPPRPALHRPSSSSAILPPRLRTLQRSQSALPSILSQPSALSNPLVPHLPRGRSRDTRTWEFCCDPDARDELTTQAENESSGSAIAAISLIRSTSNSGLKSSSNKRNAPAKAAEGTNKKPKLGRAQSSLARLQGTNLTGSKQNIDGKRKPKTLAAHSPSGDSDKENWAPAEASGNPRRRRPLPSSSTSGKATNSKQVLGDNLKVPSQARNVGASAGGRKRRKQGNETTEVFEDEGDKENAEVPGDVERFMRGEVSPGKKGDLDCIKGLLSLSQGNWR